MYKAEVIADSLSPQNHRLTTLRVVMPRMILAEFNTHRMLGRNSASSRAIPFKTMVETVEKNPFFPLKWMVDHQGMQGSDFVIDQKIDMFRTEQWATAAKNAILSAKSLNVDVQIGKHKPREATQGKGVTKQFCNRLLEPFMWHTVLVSATEWENFFALRAHKDAEIHMQKVAETMLRAMNKSVPVSLHEGEWHIPFKYAIDQAEVAQYVHHVLNIENEMDFNKSMTNTLVKISTMMSARTSYTVPTKDLSEWTVENYVKKHDMMAASGHWSPFEHPARCMRSDEYINYAIRSLDENNDPVTLHGWCGNYRGWIQYRKMFITENQSDSRLIKHTWNPSNSTKS